MHPYTCVCVCSLLLISKFILIGAIQTYRVLYSLHLRKRNKCFVQLNMKRTMKSIQQLYGTYFRWCRSSLMCLTGLPCSLHILGMTMWLEQCLESLWMNSRNSWVIWPSGMWPKSFSPKWRKIRNRRCTDSSPKPQQTLQGSVVRVYSTHDAVCLLVVVVHMSELRLHLRMDYGREQQITRNQRKHVQHQNNTTATAVTKANNKKQKCMHNN